MKNTTRYNLTGVIPVAIALSLLVASLLVEGVQAELVIYPAKGQDAEQQKQDDYECHQWAVEQTEFDPTTTQQVPQVKPKDGGALRGAAGGAMVGVGIGAIAGDAGKGAAIGAGAGAVGVGLKQRQQRQQQETVARQSQASHQANVATFTTRPKPLASKAGGIRSSKGQSRHLHLTMEVTMKEARLNGPSTVTFFINDEKVG
jgi:hypothetical protein